MLGCLFTNTGMWGAMCEWAKTVGFETFKALPCLLRLVDIASSAASTSPEIFKKRLEEVYPSGGKFTCRVVRLNNRRPS